MISQQLKADQADVFFGTGAFVDAHTVRVQPGQTRPASGSAAGAGGEVLLRGESILIATGSSPLRPALFPFGSPEIYDSDTILALGPAARAAGGGRRGGDRQRIRLHVRHPGDARCI